MRIVTHVCKSDNGLVCSVRIKIRKTNFCNAGDAVSDRLVTRTILLCEGKSIKIPEQGNQYGEGIIFQDN